MVVWITWASTCFYFKLKLLIKAKSRKSKELKQKKWCEKHCQWISKGNLAVLLPMFEFDKTNVVFSTDLSQLTDESMYTIHVQPLSKPSK